MRNRFIEGLKDKVQTQLVQDLPDTLEDLYHVVIEIDG